MSTLPIISDEDTKSALSQKLTEIRKHSLEDEVKQEAQAKGIPYVSLVGKPISPTVISLLDRTKAEKHRVVVYKKDQGTLYLAALDPTHVGVRKIVTELESEYNHRSEIAQTAEESMEHALKEYDNVRSVNALGTINIDESEIESLSNDIADFRKIGSLIHKHTLTQFLNITLAAALNANASDLHFQPEKTKTVVKMRVDGILHSIFDLKPLDYIEIKKRLKLIAKLKINIEEKPQDGGFTIQVHGTSIDLRISTLPSEYGESIVLRILNPNVVKLDFEELGLRGRALEITQETIKKPNGMIVACGPTGSGKTTTLYAILKNIDHEEQKVITLENPIEYKLEGIVQTEIHKEKLNFVEGLKTILRQDPDIIMVGEIRDLETADTAVNAALTGHLVITSLHTNNAAGAIPRFLAMGVKPFLLAPSVNLIIAERLVRKLCEHCKEKTTLDEKTMKLVQKELINLPAQESEKIDLDSLTFYAAKGCDKCGGIGLKGRIGIFEVLRVDENLAEAIQEKNLTEFKIAELAAAQGMVTIVQDGLLKAADGITSVEEVFRVVD